VFESKKNVESSLYAAYALCTKVIHNKINASSLS
jgi:hypothetical protein